jgi:hypothetical protein
VGQNLARLRAQGLTVAPDVIFCGKEPPAAFVGLSPVEGLIMESAPSGGNTRRRRATGLVVAVLAFTAVMASAASLGGVSAGSLGADTAVIASCDTDGVTLAYGGYSLSGNAYRVGSVAVGSINAACNGKAIRVSLTDGTNSLGEATGTVASGAASLTFTAPGPDAKAATTAAVIISG